MKRPELGSDGWLLFQENASAHMTLSVKQFLTNKNITVMGHFPYSSDLTPYPFFSFPTVKFYCKGSHFTSVEKVQTKTENLKRIPKPSFQNCYQQRQHRMQKCVNVEGSCFEFDNVSEN
ncbi:mariner Mos1 transposase [Trichonephila clavipes]|nr:mariner Mos1 transposase [Trichonephila clavipes]